MQVEIVGGPRDGEMLEVRNGTHEIRFPVSAVPPSYHDWTAAPPLGEIETIVLPVLKRVDGKMFVQWKKGN